MCSSMYDTRIQIPHTVAVFSPPFELSFGSNMQGKPKLLMLAQTLQNAVFRLAGTASCRHAEFVQDWRIKLHDSVPADLISAVDMSPGPGQRTHLHLHLHRHAARGLGRDLQDGFCLQSLFSLPHCICFPLVFLIHC